MELALTLILLAAMAGTIGVAHGRHRRVMRRLGRLEAANHELLQLMKPLVAARAGGEGEAVEFRSQFGEDLVLWHLFAGKRGGFFIEVGAYDGYTYSVTFAFEQAGWTGLLVEPLPARFEACRDRRPRSRVVNAALSVRGSTGTATFHHIASDKKHYEASSYLDAGTQRRRHMRPPKGNVQTVTVPLTTMDNLLAEHAGPIDFVVLDVEGHELSLLDGFDLDRFKPAVLMVEDQSMGRDPELHDYLAKRGYEHVMWLSYNRVMIRRDRPELLARARSLAQ
ncbi:MAG: FkbM family methyltransferase [Phycisphaerales bacterium]